MGSHIMAKCLIFILSECGIASRVPTVSALWISMVDKTGAAGVANEA